MSYKVNSPFTAQIPIFGISRNLFLPDFLADVLSEDTIIKWYKGGYSQKGKTVFLEQMKKMVEWLQSAEEGIWQLHVGIVFQPDHVFLPPFTSPPPPSLLGSITP